MTKEVSSEETQKAAQTQPSSHDSINTEKTLLPARGKEATVLKEEKRVQDEPGEAGSYSIHSLGGHNICGFCPQSNEFKAQK